MPVCACLRAGLGCAQGRDEGLEGGCPQGCRTGEGGPCQQRLLSDGAAAVGLGDVWTSACFRFSAQPPTAVSPPSAVWPPASRVSSPSLSLHRAGQENHPRLPQRGGRHPALGGCCGKTDRQKPGEATDKLTGGQRALAREGPESLNAGQGGGPEKEPRGRQDSADRISPAERKEGVSGTPSLRVRESHEPAEPVSPVPGVPSCVQAWPLPARCSARRSRPTAWSPKASLATPSSAPPPPVSSGHRPVKDQVLHSAAFWGFRPDGPTPFLHPCSESRGSPTSPSSSQPQVHAYPRPL